jgi:hypothetical protein
MHSGSGSGTKFGSGSNIKLNQSLKNVKNIKNERPTVQETMLLLSVKRQYFGTTFL